MGIISRLSSIIHTCTKKRQGAVVLHSDLDFWKSSQTSHRSAFGTLPYRAFLHIFARSLKSGSWHCYPDWQSTLPLLWGHAIVFSQSYKGARSSINVTFQHSLVDDVIHEQSNRHFFQIKSPFAQLKTGYATSQTYENRELVFERLINLEHFVHTAHFEHKNQTCCFYFLLYFSQSPHMSISLSPLM